VGLVELFAAVLIVGLSSINAAPPAAAWSRSGDARFLLIVAAQLGLAALGALWTWGQLPLSPPSWSGAQFPVLGVVLLVALLFLATTIWPRRT
jgi:hypothetical protein